MKILLSVAYDGTNYFGWQRQIDKNTIDQEIEKALLKIYSQNIRVLGASRTDSGVHSLDQKCIFSIDKTSIPVENLKFVLNKFLPLDIRITNSEEAEEDFNLFLAVKSKTYSYTIDICKFENPKNRLYAYHSAYELNIEKMIEASKYFLGKHDFIGFSSTGSPREDTVRTINYLDIKKQGDLIYIIINGDGFLYNMVRIISGTLLEVGRGKINPEEIEDIIKSKNRKKAGKTAPAMGLTLEKIYLE